MKVKVSRKPLGKVLDDPIDEAMRYYANANEILQKKGGIDAMTKFYTDKKYVRLAGHCYYSGILIALDGLMTRTNYDLTLKPGARKSVNTYKTFLKVIGNRTLQSYFNEIYDVAHLHMGYDGTGSLYIVADDIFLRIIEQIKIEMSKR